MSPAGGDAKQDETSVTVRYWASARAAAGVPEEHFVGPMVLEALVAAALERHGGAPELARVLNVCSVLVDGTRADRETVIQPGSTVEFLPPFAGG
jgi:sulfur-carrier protein